MSKYDEADTQATRQSELLSELVLKEEEKEQKGPGLIAEPDPEPSQENFSSVLKRSLSEAEGEVLEVTKTNKVDAGDDDQWRRARRIVEQFQPVPWFIWRINNFVFSKSGHINPISEGLVLGLRRLLFAAASDPFLGVGNKVNNVREALRLLSPDVVAALSVIHAVCRRLGTRPFERIWHPILDDAILRAQIGYLLGKGGPTFGAGRGMLAGFSGRTGLAILIAGGELEQARKALEMLASGTDTKTVGLSLYECDPLQVSAMTLSASGCGRDAAFGTVAFASTHPSAMAGNDEQRGWLSAFTIVELIRMGREDEIEQQYWQALGYESGKLDVIEAGKALIRKGHGIKWIV